MMGSRKDVGVCALQSELEERVWVDEQEIFPCRRFLKTLGVGAVKERQHE